MISPAWHIRDAVDADMELVRALFAEEGMGSITSPEGVRVAASPDNVIYGAIRCELMADGVWYIRPIVVFEVARGRGVGRTLVEDALKRHPDLRLVSEGSAAAFYDACGFEHCSFDEIDPVLIGECEACPGKDTCGPVPFKSKPVQHALTFLGTTSGCGVPAFFCHCKACEAARKDPTLRRGCSGVIVQGHATVLIDTPPDLRHQLIREDVSFIDEVFLTHAHFDHLGGFGELEYFVRLYLDQKLPFHASPYALNDALAEFSYMDDCFITDEIEPWHAREVDGLIIQAVPVDHCPGCYGYLITAPSGTRTFYAPDTATLRPDVKEVLHGVDNLIMDATFWGETGNFKTHHSVQQTVAEGLELDAGRIYLTHFAPHICAPEENVEELAAEYIKQFEGRVIMARDGMKVGL